MVKAWKEIVSIPTYEVGKKKKIPSSSKSASIKAPRAWYILTLSSNQSQM